MTAYLVGAGPGDLGLLTLRAAELIARADVVLYDKLIPQDALKGARADAELIYVGKQGGGPQVPQEDTNALLLRLAQAGKEVVRLKGGDPFVFGRGGEEAQLLREAGVPYEVVPGVTAGIAAPAYGGIPVTQRDMATAVAFVTGHENPAKPESQIDWPALAAFPGTLVFYMGVKALPRIASELVAGGRPPTQAVAIVERGTLPDQRTTHGTLADIATRAEDAGVRAPAVTVVGDVAALGESLAWLEARPLHGVSVAVTRARAQASPMAVRLRDLGASVVEAPAIRTRTLDARIPDVSSHDLVVVTSPNGAHELFGGLERAGRDARSLAGRRIAAIGPGTARALREHGIVADVVPDRPVAEGLIAALAAIPIASAIVFRAREAREELVRALHARGASVDVVALYETVADPLDEAEVAAASACDWITFTSGSSVRFFAEACGGTIPAGPRLASIGPATSEVLREHGREPDLEADPHTPDGLVAALVAAARD